MSAKLTFYTGTMRQGKSKALIELVQSRVESGSVYTQSDRSGHALVTSRSGASINATEIDANTDLRVEAVRAFDREHSWIVIDEAQFLTYVQVEDLAWAVDTLWMDVDCFGLDTNDKCELFPAASALYALADSVVRLPNPLSCQCGDEARYQILLDDDGNVAEIPSGSKHIGDDGFNLRCRRCMRDSLDKS